uniref:Uncharacterized protein n=1 Tax=Anopheles minimus TaxID=112268 RepID=A0A182WNR2_9DIPT
MMMMMRRKVMMMGQVIRMPRGNVRLGTPVDQYRLFARPGRPLSC